MPEAPGGEDAAVVEGGDLLHVHPWRQRQRRGQETAGVGGYEVGFPLQSLDLPGSEGEGGYWDRGEEEEAWAVLLPAGADEGWGLVED